MVYGGIISPIHLNQTHANKKTQVIKYSKTHQIRDQTMICTDRLATLKTTPVSIANAEISDHSTITEQVTG